MPEIDPTALRTHLLDAAGFRHATKRFDPERRIPEEDFALLLEIARLSPTSFGMETWSMLVVQDPAVRERLRTVGWGAQGQLPTASHFLVLTTLRAPDLAPESPRLAAHLREVKGLSEQQREGMTARFASFVKDDFRLDSPDRIEAWAARQTYIVLGNVMAAAAQLGIDSCPIEGFHRDTVEEILDGLGGYRRDRSSVTVMLALGYRVDAPRPKSRRPLDAVVGRV